MDATRVLELDLTQQGIGVLELAVVVWCGKASINVLVSKAAAENLLTVIRNITVKESFDDE